MRDDLHELAPGGWRRAVVGLVLGAVLGVLVRAVTDRDVEP